MNAADLYDVNRETIEWVTRAIARRYGLSPAHREDFVQEVWLCLLRNDGRALRAFRGGARFETYLWKIVSRSCARWRARQATRERVAAVRDLDKHARAVASIPDLPFESNETKDTARRLGLELDDLIRRLSVSDRELLSLRFMQGMDAAEIAEFTHSTRAAIFKRLDRLLRRLRASLIAAGFSHADVAGILRSAHFDWSGTRLIDGGLAPAGRSESEVKNPEPRTQNPGTTRGG